MATTVTRSIGTAGGRDYSTLATWIAACPVNLVTADQIWRGECYNDSEFTAGLAISGRVTDATRYIELTAAAGQSFQDHASVRTNALRYNQANGVGINVTGAPAISYSGAGVMRISRLQIKAAGYEAYAGTFTSLILQDCIVTNDGSFYSNATGVLTDNGTFVNNVLYRNSAWTDPMVKAYMSYAVTTSLCLGNTVVRLTGNTPGGAAFSTNYGTLDCRSNAMFGFTSPTSGTATGSNNGSNVASGLPGTSNQHSVTFNATTPFVQASATGTDLRAIAATSLAANGYLDSVTGPDDISDFARPANPTIGAWQLAGAPAATAFARPVVVSQAVGRAGSF